MLLPQSAQFVHMRGLAAGLMVLGYSEGNLIARHPLFTIEYLSHLTNFMQVAVLLLCKSASARTDSS